MNYPPQAGGLSTYYSNLARLLSEQDHKVYILMAEPNSTANDDDRVTEEKKITRVLLKKSFHEARNYYKRYFRPGGFEAHSWIANGLAARAWLQNNHVAHKIDIVQTPDYGGLGIFLSGNDLPPVVVFGHGCLTQLSRYNYVKNDSHASILKKLEKLSFEQADAIMTHSPLNQLDLAKLCGQNVEMTIAPWKNDAGLVPSLPGNDSIAVAGGLQAVKGAVVMAQAMQSCAIKNPSLRVNWFGGDTYSAPGNRSMAGYLGKNFPGIWNKNFVWRKEKSREETRKEIAASSFVVIPSLWETFGWTVLEAAAAGKAMIITDKTGAVYLFTHGIDAWIIPANNSTKLAEAIEVLHKDPELCKYLGSNAKKMLENRFNEKAIVTDRIKLFGEVIRKRKTRTINFAEQTAFLSKYTTPTRKLYYGLRALGKKILGVNKPA